MADAGLAGRPGEDAPQDRAADHGGGAGAPAAGGGPGRRATEQAALDLLVTGQLDRKSVV